MPQRQPRAIPDTLWDELFAQMRWDRDRALLSCYVSSGARAPELLGIRLSDIDWAKARLWVISKGSRRHEPVPASPEAFAYLACYLDQAGLPEHGMSVWRTRRGEPRPLTYWAMRQVLTRANTVLGINWTLHDLRHTAAARMARDPSLTLPEVQTILRHAHITTTARYTVVGLEDLLDRVRHLDTAAQMTSGARYATGAWHILALRVMQPGLAALRANRFPTYPKQFRHVANDPSLDKFFEQVHALQTYVANKR